MFVQLFFLILNLFLIASATNPLSPPFLEDHPGLAFGLFCICYLILLPILYYESKLLYRRFRFPQTRIMFIINLELLVFFGCFYFLLGANQWLIHQLYPFDASGFTLIALTLYFTALFICRYALESWKRTILSDAWNSVAFLLPFSIPFLLFTFLSNGSSLLFQGNGLSTIGIDEGSFWELFLFSAFNIAAIIATILFLPLFTVLIWQCPELKDESLKQELVQVCNRAHFRHGGLRIWSVMHDSMTAAILGVWGKFRYILFSQKLLDHVPPRAISAILAHEIGHSAHYHLIFYPLIFLGMVTIGSLATTLIYYLTLSKITWESHISLLLPFLLFCVFGAGIALYFRFIFGYFSRLFERQADLHIFRLAIPAEDMIEALDILGTSSGNIHDEPNWHHHSIRERMDFLRKADIDRTLISSHDFTVRRSLILYFIALLISLVTLYSLT